MTRPAALFALLFVSQSLLADRVRVVVAVGAPEVSSASVTALRADVMETLRDATGVVPWGDGPAFSAEIDREEIEPLSRDPRVRAVTIDTGGAGAMAQSIPIVRADVVNAAGWDGSGITVAVIDGGIDRAHPDFAGRIVSERCFCTRRGAGCCPNGESMMAGEGAAQDEDGHGTHVTGIVAGGGAVAHKGVAPGAKIVAVKVMDRDGFDDSTQLFRALDWIALNRPDVRVINMSLGTHALFSSANCDSAAISLGLAPVIRTLRDQGVLITASSGNQSSLTGTTLPACMPDVLGVGATWDSAPVLPSPYCADPGAKADTVTCFTNSTDGVDLVAPGAPITSSRRGGGTSTFYGTSMAAPHVAGTIALMLQLNGSLTADMIEHLLKTTGQPVTDARSQRVFPRLSTLAAVSAALPAQTGPRRRSVRK